VGREPAALFRVSLGGERDQGVALVDPRLDRGVELLAAETLARDRLDVVAGQKLVDVAHQVLVLRAEGECQE
jgi:hypothetical protein